MRTQNCNRRIAAGASVLLAGLAICATAGPATAASLTAETECRNIPPNAECIITEAVRYIGGAERNRVVVSSAVSTAVVLYDPGVPITTSGVETPQLTDPLVGDLEYLDVLPVSSTRSCVAPTGKSVGLCAGTPGRACALYNGCFTELPSFSVAELALGDGADSLRLLPGSLRTEVAAGAGNDTIDSHNQATDQIDCGTGFDTVIAEWRDVVSSTCEKVTRGLLAKP